ncbi:MAG TPA: HEPN domain-containing protein [Chloroflexia bacterium]|jgi:HEPN domain-containing protein
MNDPPGKPTKTHTDLALGLLRKAASDWTVAQLCLNNQSFDGACFHAQQAAEKCLKAYLAAQNAHYDLTHNLRALVRDCIAIDSSFPQIDDEAKLLTPYAVELRYDIGSWPPQEEAVIAVANALKIRDFVLPRLPATLQM